MADDLDVITLPEAHSAINLSEADSDHDTELERIVTAASRHLDRACGPIVVRDVEEWQDGGSGVVWPYQTPVVEITSVTEYSGTTATALTAETESVNPTSGYLLHSDGHNTTIYRRSGGTDARFPSGRRRVKLVYVAGRYDDTDAVDPLFKEAAAILVQQLWRGTSGAWSQSPDFLSNTEQRNVPWRLPPSVADLLAMELRPPALA